MAEQKKKEIKDPFKPGVVEGATPHVIKLNESPLEQAERQAKEKQEAGPSQEPAFFEGIQGIAIRPEQLKTKAVLTLEITAIQHLGQLVCVTLSELYTTMIPGFDAAKTPTETYCIDVQDIRTGHPWRLICNAVMASEFRRLEKPIKGRYFALQSMPVQPGKRYRPVRIAELDV